MNKEKMQRKTLVGVFLVLGIIFTLLGSTLAYYTWRGNITAINFTITRSFECSGDMGGPITSNQLAPASCTNSTYAIQRQVTINPVINSPGMSIYMDLWLDVTMDAGLAASSNFKYALTRNPNSCTDNVIETGTFKGKDRVELLSNQPFTYRTDLTQKPNLSTTGYLYVWLDAAEEDPATQGNNFTLTLGGQCTQGPYVTGGAAMLINKANNSSITTYTSGNTGEMYTFSQPETVQVPSTTDYRYIGSNPNNYIEFNNQIWRIIGVIDGKIKIIKDTPIENIKFDNKNQVGSSKYSGSNDWVDSQLMYMLNPDDIPKNVALKTGYSFDGMYVRDSKNQIIYQSGCKPASVSTATTSYSCTASPWSLNATALNQVADTTYYLGMTDVSVGGGAAEPVDMSFSNLVLYQNSSEMHFLASALEYNVREWYISERGDELYDTSRSLSWTGKVGLAYPSDYGYTFAYGVNTSCYNRLYPCNDSEFSSWLSTSSYVWTLTSSSKYSDVNFAFNIHLSNHTVSDSYVALRPVVYLKPHIELTGNGTNDENIYRIVG